MASSSAIASRTASMCVPSTAGCNSPSSCRTSLAMLSMPRAHSAKPGGTRIGSATYRSTSGVGELALVAFDIRYGSHVVHAFLPASILRRIADDEGANLDLDPPVEGIRSRVGPCSNRIDRIERTAAQRRHPAGGQLGFIDQEQRDGRRSLRRQPQIVLVGAFAAGVPHDL